MTGIHLRHIHNELAKHERVDVKTLSKEVKIFLLTVEMQSKEGVERLAKDLEAFKKIHRNIDGLEAVCKTVQEFVVGGVILPPLTFEILELIKTAPDGQQSLLFEMACSLAVYEMHSSGIERILAQSKRYSIDDREWVWSIIADALSDDTALEKIIFWMHTLVLIPEKERKERGELFAKLQQEVPLKERGALVLEIIDCPSEKLPYANVLSFPSFIEEIEDGRRKVDMFLTYALGFPEYSEQLEFLYSERVSKGLDTGSFQIAARYASKHQVCEFSSVVALIESYLDEGVSLDMCAFLVSLLKNTKKVDKLPKSHLLISLQGALLLHYSTWKNEGETVYITRFHRLLLENMGKALPPSVLGYLKVLFKEEALNFSASIPSFIKDIKDKQLQGEIFAIYLAAGPVYREDLERLYKEKQLSLDSFGGVVSLVIEEGIYPLSPIANIIYGLKKEGCSRQLSREFCLLIQGKELSSQTTLAEIKNFIKRGLLNKITARLEEGEFKQAYQYLKLAQSNAKPLGCHPAEELGMVLMEYGLKQENKENALNIHGRLYEKQKEPIQHSVADVYVGKGKKHFSLKAFRLQEQGGMKEKTYQELPDIQKDTLQHVLRDLKTKVLGDERYKEAVSEYGDLEELSTNLESKNRRVYKILHQPQGKPYERVPFILDKLCYIVKRIEMSTDLPEEGESLSKKEMLTLGLARSTFQCPAGQEEGICQFYAALKIEEGETFKGADEEGVASALQPAFALALNRVEGLLSSENSFTKKLIGSEAAFKQMTHQTQYLKNLLAKSLRLHHDTTFDLYGRLVDRELRQKSHKEVLAIFYQEYINEVVSIIEEFCSKRLKVNDLRIFNNLLYCLEGEDPEELFTFDDALNPIKITRYGTIRLLERLGVLQDTKEDFQRLIDKLLS